MRSNGLVTVVAVALMTLASTAGAQQNQNSDKSGKIRKDPKGQTGISPYNELLAKGKSASANGRHDDAAAAFEKAIQLKPDKMYAYLLLAQTQLQQGKRGKAGATIKLGRTKKGTVAVAGKMNHLRAEVLERNANLGKNGGTLQAALASAWQKAKEGWATFKVYLEAHSQLPNYSQTAIKRSSEIDKRVKRDKEYKAVRDRRNNKK